MSGTVGHSFSFGKAGAWVILLKDTFLEEAFIEKAIEFVASIEVVD